LKPVNVGIAVLASIICAYVAAVVNGLIILNLQLIFTLTVWAGWNILGAIIGFAIALPIIAALEKAEVKKVKVE
jgi:predicted membrane protein